MRKLIPILLALCLLFAATGAVAAPCGFELVISGNVNTPTFTLTNTGLLDIDYFEMTIGDTSFNFDYVDGIVANGVSYTIVNPDYNINSGVRSDVTEFSFTDFTPGLYFEWKADIDRDNSNSSENYREILFNNGALPNSFVTVSFTGGGQLQGMWPDADSESTYTMSISSVPVPAAVWLLGSGLAGLLGLRFKKRQ